MWRIAFLLLLSSTLCLAQEFPSHNGFQYLQIPGSIRSGNVNAILQDQRGIMWFGTSDGLFSYNGRRFKQYRELAGGLHRIDGESIQCLAEIRGTENRLLIGTKNLGILAIEPGSDSLVQWLKVPVPVADIQITADGTAWVQAYPYQLTRVKRDQRGLEKIPVPDRKIPNISVLHTHDQDLYVGEITRILKLRDGKIVQEYNTQAQGIAPLPNSRFTALFVDSRHRLWAGTDRQGVFVFDVRSGKMLQHFNTQRPFYSRINHFSENRGFIWCTTKADGIAVIDPATWKWEHYSTRDRGTGIIGGNNGFTSFADHTGMMWLGINSDINLYDPDRFYFEHLKNNDLDQESLSDNMIRSCWVSENNTLYAGTDGGYINIIDSKTKITQRIPVSRKEVIVPFAFCRKGPNELYVGTSHGLYIMDETKLTFQRVSQIQANLKDRRVRQLIRKGNVLYLLANGSVLKYDLKSGEVMEYHSLGRSNTTLVYTLFLDSDNRLWAGTSKPELIRLDESGEGVAFPLKSDSLNHVVLTISEPVKHQLYIGSQNGGLYIGSINSAGDFQLQQHLTAASGLPDNTIYGILPDAKGNLWMSTNTGIFVYYPSSGKTQLFDKSFGLQENEFNRLAYAKFSDGQLVFGGINGLNLVDPRRFTLDNYVPEPRILALELRNSTTPPLSTFGLSKVVLKPNQQSFTIEFGSTDYRSNRIYKFAYMLEGFDHQWIEDPGTGLAPYTSLSRGNYTFKLRITNQNGDEKLATLPIRISTPFYLTWYFLTALALIVGIVVIGLIQGRNYQNRMDKERLENLLRIRTAEIEESRRELEVLNQKKDLIFSILSHDLRSPLTTLKGFLTLLVSENYEFTLDEIRKHAQTIKNSVSNSLDLIDNTLYWSLSQMGSIQAKPVVVNLQSIFTRIRDLYQPTADKKQINLHLDISPENVMGDENMILVILRNLVSNALKFTPEGRNIRIKSIRVQDRVEITVADEGIGMAAEHLDLLLKRKQVVIMRGTQQEKGTGLGLLLVKSFVEENHGQFSITSIEGIGTVATVILPASS